LESKNHEHKNTMSNIVETPKRKCVLIYSGGLDSTVALCWLRNEGYEVIALSCDYGQRHVTEIAAAEKMCRKFGVKHKVADLKGISEFLAGSSQTSREIAVPHGHYADENMKKTVVPNRNMIMLSVATAWAIQEKAIAVAFGAHNGDHAIYPDCRPEFSKAMGQAIRLCDWHAMELLRPFINKTKTEIVSMGSALDVPMEETWSCYEGNEFHCGKCGTCVERREAFAMSGVHDKTIYRESPVAKQGGVRGDLMSHSLPELVTIAQEWNKEDRNKDRQIALDITVAGKEELVTAIMRAAGYNVN
jgi:7-cyano-7-deazaguanine synthase